jgi:hypothetical protein
MTDSHHSQQKTFDESPFSPTVFLIHEWARTHPVALDSSTLYWCVRKLMLRNDLTSQEALEMLGIGEEDDS